MARDTTPGAQSPEALQPVQEDAALSAAEFLDHVLKQRGLDQLQLAELTGVSRQTINAIVRGRQPISRAMSARLGRLFGQPPDFWLREQFRRASNKLTETTAPQHVPDTAAPGAVVLPDARRSKLLTDEEIHLAIDQGLVAVSPFNKAHVHAASLDLCLGQIDVSSTPAAEPASGMTVIEIAPLECVHAWSLETVRLPPTMMARVGPMARHAHLGLFLGHGLQVDPGFGGKLAFSLFNASPNPISLPIGKPILSLELMELGTPSLTPAVGANATRTFAEDAAVQFAGAGPLERVRRHLRMHLETIDLEGAQSHVARIRTTDIEAESTDRITAQEACLENCLRIIRDEARTEQRRHRRSGRWEPLQAILGELKLERQDFDTLLREATLIDHDNGSATVALPSRQQLALPYPDHSISVRVRQLTSPMHLDVSAFVIVEYLITDGREFAIFPEPD